MSDTTSAAPTEARKPRPKRIGTGRVGKIRAALRRALDDARDNGRMTTEHELTGALADKVAALVDDYAAAGDGAGMLKAAKELRDLLDTLPVREIRGEGAPSDGASGRAQLHAIISSPPEVGDTAHP